MRRDQRTRPPSGPGDPPRASSGHPGAGSRLAVRQIGEALAIPAVVFAVLVARRWRRRLGYLAVTAASFAVPVIGFMTISLVTGHGFALTSERPDILYGRAAVARLPADERSLCPSPSVAAGGIDEIINNARNPYQSYRPSPGTTKEHATHDFDLRVLRQQPLAIPLSVLRDAVRLFAVIRDGAANITPIARWQFQPVYPTYPLGVTTSFVAAEGQRYGGGGAVTVRPLATFLRAYQLDGGYTPPWWPPQPAAGPSAPAAACRRRLSCVGRRRPGNR